MKKSLPLYLAILLLPPVVSSQVVVNDSWADGNRFKTLTEGELDADLWSSSSSGGNSVEVEIGAMGLVSGPSGRGSHVTFTPQDLAIGDTLVATFTFTTPATVGSDLGGAFKVALMEFNNSGLAADLTSSSVDPNPLYTDLPGYMLEFDVNNSDATDDTGIRKHDTPNTIGRFLSTSTEWTTLGSSADADYAILPNTEYVGEMSITRTGEDSAQIFGSLSQNGARLDSFTATDSSGIANNIGMIGFWANSNAFGSTNFSGDPDNGITFSNLTIELNPQVTIISSIDDSFADGDRTSTEAADADWWSSSAANGNSVEVSVGELGLVTGSSGRGMHATFAPQTLEIGETLVATSTFTTPATVGTDRGSGLKFALMELSDPGLAADLESSSTIVNLLYTDFPGYLIDLDVNTGATADVTIRKHDSPNTTGRFLGTTSEWTSLGSSGDAGYTFEPNTEYRVEMTALRTGEDSLEFSGSLSQGEALLDSFTVSDASGIPSNFGVFGVWANSDTFGSTNLSDVPDNGLTFTNVKIGRIEIPTEPVESGPVITKIVYDKGAGTVSIDWNAENGTTYFVFGSSDLNSFEEELGDVTADGDVASFTEGGVTAPRRFYRVVPLVLE